MSAEPDDRPLDCSLSPSEMVGREAELRELTRQALARRWRTAQGVRLEYRRSDAVEATVRDLVRRERECCPFLELGLEAHGDRLTLDIRGPGGATRVLDEIYERSAPSTVPSVAT